MSTPTVADFRALAEKLLLPSYDFMVVCDGSGTTMFQPCGYYAATHDAGIDNVAEFHGGASHGSNNWAELSPFLLAFANIEQRLTGDTPHVACVSDSELTVKAAQGIYRRNANLSLWAAYDYFAKEQGWRFTWRHVRRNSNPINNWADHEAGRSRNAIELLLTGGE
jgi:ribonuclease HI